jgi:hypothetical protein
MTPTIINMSWINFIIAQIAQHFNFNLEANLANGNKIFKPLLGILCPHFFRINIILALIPIISPSTFTIHLISKTI